MLFVITALEEPGVASCFYRIAQFAPDRGAIVIGIVVTRSGDEILDINALQTKLEAAKVRYLKPGQYCVTLQAMFFELP